MIPEDGNRLLNLISVKNSIIRKSFTESDISENPHHCKIVY